ncbi:MAG: hypothetical protein NC251_12355 [Lachnoclostridium sp.]|nr:hypothetical protein [Lachnospira sp.]MCM1249206.1 hypothetical protein [Lachnoclostridium sp.]MCM1535490.1 hypothetical protein [Clostridium sp.]
MSMVLILNAIGLLCGFFHQEIFMYILFGITWTAFFYDYEKLTWPFYEKMTRGESDIIVTNVRMMNLVTVIIVLVSVYSLMLIKMNKICVIMSMVQFMIMQGIKAYRQSTTKNIAILIGALVELAAAFLL